MARANDLTSSQEVLERAGPLLSGHRRLVIALSGGADSAVAAWAAVQAAGAARVRAVYVHHGLAASDRLGGAASAVADRLDIPFTVAEVVVPSGPSFEGQARAVRLAALEGDAGEDEMIVTGHHQGDLAETVLANLLRGAGAEGLSGIAARRGPWLRPLLEVPADVVRAAARELALPFVDDPTNDDPGPARNVLRLEILPTIASRLGRPVTQPLARAADLLSADDATLTAASRVIAVAEHEAGIHVSASELAVVPRAVAARAARRMLRLLHPPYPGTADDVTSILEVADARRLRAQLSGGAHAVREGPLVVVYESEPEPPPALPLPIDAAVSFGPWSVSMRPVRGPAPILLGRHRVVSRALPDAVVRASADGERIEFEAGSKPVREAMAEAGIPVRLRAAWPVVVAGGKIAWVPGARLAAWAHAPGEAHDSVVLAIEGTRA